MEAAGGSGGISLLIDTAFPLAASSLLVASRVLDGSEDVGGRSASSAELTPTLLEAFATSTSASSMSAASALDASPLWQANALMSQPGGSFTRRTPMPRSPRRGVSFHTASLPAVSLSWARITRDGRTSWKSFQTSSPRFPAPKLQVTLRKPAHQNVRASRMLSQRMISRWLVRTSPFHTPRSGPSR